MVDHAKKNQKSQCLYTLQELRILPPVTPEIKGSMDAPSVTVIVLIALIVFIVLIV